MILAQICSITIIHVKRNGGMAAYMRPLLKRTREGLVNSTCVRDNIGVFKIKNTGYSQLTYRAYPIVHPILSVGSSVWLLRESFDQIFLSQSDY